MLIFSSQEMQALLCLESNNNIFFKYTGYSYNFLLFSIVLIICKTEMQLKIYWFLLDSYLRAMGTLYLSVVIFYKTRPILGSLSAKYTKAKFTQ